MRSLVVLATVVAGLALPAMSAAGGWATVGFQPLPDGMSAGATWKPRIFVKQHGVTPLSGLRPLVVLEEANTGESAEYVAAETSEAGVYRADVVFPDAGDWRVTIHSGFGDSYVTYGPTRIGAPGGSREWWPLALVSVAAGVGGLALVGARRAGRLSPASS